MNSIDETVQIGLVVEGNLENLHPLSLKNPAKKYRIDNFLFFCLRTNIIPTVK